MKTFMFKIRRNHRLKFLHLQINLASEVYNHCIALHRRYYRRFGKSLNVNHLMKHLTKLKKTRKFSHWNQLGSQAIQDVAQRIDRAYSLFFRNLKAGKRTAPPNFKGWRRYKSFTLKQCGWKLIGDGKIRIGTRVFKFHQSREITGIIKTVTVKRDQLGDIYLFFSAKQEQTETMSTTGKIAAYDFGLKTFLYGWDGEENDVIDSPQFFKEGLNSVRKANRNLSRKKRGSNNRRKARQDLFCVHRKIARQRRDWFFKTARRICEGRSHVFLEDLNLEGMKKLWGRKVSDYGFGEFVQILIHVGKKIGTVVHQIDRWFPSSKTCSECGTINESLTLKDRTWTCVCGVFHYRDQNAAKNIRRVGVSTLRLEGVRPGCPASFV